MLLVASPGDLDVLRESVVATIAHAQCMKLCTVLDQVRKLLAGGSVDEGECRTDTDLKTARSAIESRLTRLGILVSSLSTIGLDAELGHLPVSRVIRTFWGCWTQKRLASVEQCVQEPSPASFQDALNQVASLIGEHELFQRYLCDIRNKRDHDEAVHRFLMRYLETTGEDPISVAVLHGQGLCATSAGVALLLGVSIGQARRHLKKLQLGEQETTRHRGAILYNLESLTKRCREANVQFSERIPKKLAEEPKYFRAPDPPS